MEYDTERAKNKRDELIKIAEQALVNKSDSIGFKGSPSDAQLFVSEIIDQFIDITPPEKEEIVLGLITMNTGGRGGGRSTKPGNMLLNIRKLITAVASGVLTVAGTVTAPWTAPFAAILVWDSIYTGLNVDLSEREAVVLWTLWKNRDENDCVPEAGLLDKVNSELETHGRNPMKLQELNDALGILKHIKCIERLKSAESLWWLREWVRINYR